MRRTVNVLRKCDGANVMKFMERILVFEMSTVTMNISWKMAKYQPLCVRCIVVGRYLVMCKPET